MKKIFKYFALFLSVAFVTACFPEETDELTEVGLSVKTIFPTKVVPGMQITVNGSGFSELTEVVFPAEVSVTNFKIVTDNMIRVTTPKGISEEGGKLIVKTATDQAESSVAITVGKTQISGYSKQEGEDIGGGEQLTIYGTDLEFISSVDIQFDVDNETQHVIIKDTDFYRKSTGNVMITLPKKMTEGNVVISGKVKTIDGREFDLPTLNYSPASDGGHWETVETVIWENPDPDGNGPANWNGTYRFAGEGFETGEEIAIIPTETWEKMKSEKFYMKAQGSDWVQMRIVTGWWNAQWPAADTDITTGNEMIIDNGDGTYYIEIDFTGADILEVIDAQHLLFTGSGYTPLKLYFQDEVWVGEGHMEILKTSIWKNDDPEGHGPANWNGTYRFAGEGFETGEEIAIIPTDLWEKMKTNKFYMMAQGSDWVQMRIVTGWWNAQWPAADTDITTGNEMIIDNGDGTYYIEIDFTGADILELIDAQHLLFTGSGFTPLELYFQEEVWVGGGDAAPKEVDFWVNDDPEGHGPANWNGTYRFAGEGFETGEEIAIIPADTWAKLKSQKFYMMAQGSDWVQMRIVTGWWNAQWPAADTDITTGNEMIVDNEDGTYYIEIDFTGADILELIDAQHLLFTGSGFTPLKLYFME